jgi:hypothetical protein
MMRLRIFTATIISRKQSGSQLTATSGGISGHPGATPEKITQMTASFHISVIRPKSLLVLVVLKVVLTGGDH